MPELSDIKQLLNDALDKVDIQLPDMIPWINQLVKLRLRTVVEPLGSTIGLVAELLPEGIVQRERELETRIADMIRRYFAPLMMRAMNVVPVIDTLINLPIIDMPIETLERYGILDRIRGILNNDTMARRTYAVLNIVMTVAGTLLTLIERMLQRITGIQPKKYAFSP